MTAARGQTRHWDLTAPGTPERHQFAGAGPQGTMTAAAEQPIAADGTPPCADRAKAALRSPFNAAESKANRDAEEALVVVGGPMAMAGLPWPC
jgi:hypothetical protein